MSEYINIDTKQFRGSGFMTISKYNNKGDIIYIGDKDSKNITAIDTIDYNVIGTFEGHNGIIWSLDISKNDDILVSASGDLTIGFFNATNGTKLFQINERCIPKYVLTQKKRNNTNLVAIICEALTKKSTTYISIYDLDNINLNDFTEKTKLMWSRQSKPTVMIWLNDDEIIIGCDDGKIIIRNINDIDGSNEKEFIIHSNSIKSIVWNKNFTQILTGSLDCTAKQIDTSNWNVLLTYKSTVPVNWACWNHNDRKVFLGGGIEAMNVAKSSSNDLNLKIYRTSDQKLTNHISSHFGPIRYIDKSPCSKNFMSASQDGSVKIYFITDIESNKNILEDVEKENLEKTNITNNSFIKFGNALFNDSSLINETNKMINLSWKPPKIKEQIVQNWVPGMPIPKEDNSGLFQFNNSNDNLNNKLYEFNKNEEEQNSTIRITNLPYSIKQKDLFDLFDLYGRIEERGGVKILDYGDSVMAFIKYTYPESAYKAIDNMDGYVIDYLIIKVELAKRKN
jgi:translation initiation factor 3 subunit I